MSEILSQINENAYKFAASSKLLALQQGKSKMYRWLVCALILALSHMGATAQTRSYVGVRGGAQASFGYIAHTLFPLNMQTTGNLIQTSHFGLIFKHFNFRRATGKGVHAGFQVGANYIERGWKQEFSMGSPLPPYIAQLNYLEFPVEAILYGGKGRTKFFGTLGIYYERLISSDLDERPSEELLDRDDFYTYEPDRDPENGYGIRTSLGAFSDLSFGTVQLEAFASVSFSGVFEYGTRNSLIPDQSVLTSIGLSIAYLIPFGKMEF